MSQHSIIPTHINPQTFEGRDELRAFLRDYLSGVDTKELKVFATRAALRGAWHLERLKINDRKKLDRFYFFWLRSLIAASTVVFNERNNKERVKRARADADAADADAADADAADADAADICSHLNHDLQCIKEGDSLLEKPLWLANTDKNFAPALDSLAPFWSEHLFTPAIEGTLFKKENHLFFDGFLSLNEKVFEQESAEALRISIEAYIETNGHVSTTQVARLILLGNGGAGKTSLANKLCDPDKKLAVNESPTPRIQVRDHIIEDEDGKKTELNVWDFGGQVIMHSTHSFFLSERSTYIIACNSRANEQPDPWLQLLESRLTADKRMQLLIVYTHCDQKQLANSNKAPWRRDNALRRAFPHFELDFFNVDLQPEKKGDLPGFSALEKIIRERAIEEGKETVDDDVIAIRDLSKELESSQTPYIHHNDLLTRLAGKLRENVSQALRLANSYGYIFPQAPVSRDEEIDDDTFIYLG